MIPMLSLQAGPDRRGLVGGLHPEPADVGTCLRATVFYTDNIGDLRNRQGSVGSARTGQQTANAAPRFVDQDLNSPGDQSDRTSRKIAENTDPGESIGTPVSAFDEDDALLIYNWMARTPRSSTYRETPAS